MKFSSEGFDTDGKLSLQITMLPQTARVAHNPWQSLMFAADTNWHTINKLICRKNSCNRYLSIIMIVYGLEFVILFMRKIWH